MSNRINLWYLGFRRWYAIWGMAAFLLGVRMVVDFCTALVEFLRQIQAGQIQFNKLNFIIFLATVAISLGNLIGTAFSSKWAAAKEKAAAAKTTINTGP